MVFPKNNSDNTVTQVKREIIPDPCFATYLQKISMTFDVGSTKQTFKCLEGGFD